MAKRKSSNLVDGSQILKCLPAAKTEEQEVYLDALKKNDIIMAYGPAGSGKTYMSTLFGISEFLTGKYEQIVFTRPCVEANGEKLGYLPLATSITKLLRI